MSKLISVVGAPGSGKTATAVKLAQKICEMENDARVVYLSMDLAVPCMGYLFPHWKDNEVFSIGKALDRTEVYEGAVANSMVSPKNTPQLGYLGYKTMDNRYTYPMPTEDKIEDLLDVLLSMARYVIVDCGEDTYEPVESRAIKISDQVVYVINPSIKTAVYYVGNRMLFEDVDPTHRVKTLVHTTKNLFVPTDDVKAIFKGFDVTLPYSSGIIDQIMAGALPEKLKDKKFDAAMTELYEKVKEF